MKSLTQYLKECEGGGGAMPSNTLGAGNPAFVDGWGTEPLTQGMINKTPTAKTKAEDPETSKTKKKKKKDLSESILDNDEQTIEKTTYKNIPIELKGGAIYASFKHLRKSNLGEIDVFGNQLNPGDFFIVFNYNVLGTKDLTVFYIPEDQRIFQWGSHKEMCAYKLIGTPGKETCHFNTTEYRNGPKINAYRVNEIAGKIKWPIKK